VGDWILGSALDVFGLYSGVCKRGGYDNHMGINWTGQIFKEMDNYTEDNRQTGVGSSLKRHYSATFNPARRLRPHLPRTRSERCAYFGHVRTDPTSAHDGIDGGGAMAWQASCCWHTSARTPQT
jgi:hypothetical protein